MSSAITKTYAKGKTKELVPPCDTYGDHIALNLTIIHYWAATILGWTFAIVGLPIAFIKMLQTGNVLWFFGYLAIITIFAMIASFMTLFVYIYKQFTDDRI